MRILSFFLLGLLAWAEDGARVRVPVPKLNEFRVSAVVRFGAPGEALRVSAGGRMVVTPDAADSSFGIKVYSGEQEIASETELLKPVAKKGWGAGVEEELARLAALMPGWRDRWFPVRVEVSRTEIWFWFDGRAIASLPRPAELGEIVMEGPSIRDVTTAAASGARGGFQPVGLEGYSNAEGAGGLSKGLTRVGGVPFEISSRPIDVSQAGLRLRKKPSGPGSLYQNPFNSISAMDGDPLSILLRVPKRFYRRAWLLCGAVSGERSPLVTVRLARYRGEGGVFFSDATVKVPRLADTAAAPASIPFSKGRLWLVEVPIDSGAMQDILAADVLTQADNPSSVLKLDAGVPWVEIELTRELRADLNCMLPLGPQSGVEVYGVTLEESPVRMVAYSECDGEPVPDGRTGEVPGTAGERDRACAERIAGGGRNGAGDFVEARGAADGNGGTAGSQGGQVRSDVPAEGRGGAEPGEAADDVRRAASGYAQGGAGFAVRAVVMGRRAPDSSE